jgi:hypothetical protein
MKLYESAIAPLVVLIAAVMELLEPKQRATPEKRACPPCPAGLSAPPGSPHQGPTPGATLVPSAPPQAYDRGLGITSVDREGITPVLTRGGAARAGRRPEAHRSAQQGPASYPIGALCSTGPAIPLVVALLVSRAARR